MRYSASRNAFYAPEFEYADLPNDLVHITIERHAELLAARAEGAVIQADETGLPQAVLPTAEQVIAARRANAVIDRGPLCKALLAEGILPAASAILAAKGDWPPEFAAFLSALPADDQINAQIDWADASRIRYASPLLQTVALSYAGTPEAATALLDQFFGIGAE